MGHPTAVMRRKQLPYIALQRREGLQARSSGSNLRSEVEHQDEPEHSRKPQRWKIKETKQINVEENEPKGQWSDKRSVAPPWRSPAPPDLEQHLTPRPGGAQGKTAYR